MRRIHSKKHKIGTCEVNKISFLVQILLKRGDWKDSYQFSQKRVSAYEWK